MKDTIAKKKLLEYLCSFFVYDPELSKRKKRDSVDFSFFRIGTKKHDAHIFLN